MSISSNIKTGILSTSANTFFIASIILDISPPDAIFVSGFASSPTLVWIINSILSKPSLLKSVSSLFSKCTLNFAFFISKSCNSEFISADNFSPYFSRIKCILFANSSICFSNFCFCFFKLNIYSSKFSIWLISSDFSSLYFKISSIVFPYFLFNECIKSHLSSISFCSSSSKYISSLLLEISLAASCNS